MKNLTLLVRFLVILGVIVFAHSLSKSYKNMVTPVQNNTEKAILIRSLR